MSDAPEFKSFANSSTLDAHHYDPVTKTLTIRFKSGGTYKYGGVVQEHYDGLTSAESAGKFFHKTIKPGYKTSKA